MQSPSLYYFVLKNNCYTGALTVYEAFPSIDTEDVRVTF